ncbi:MAG: tRNA epoxyqueuosine(34) reductase QueG [Gemmatimonadota bacterium]
MPSSRFESRPADPPAERPEITAPAASLETRIKAQAFALGFDLVGIAATGPAATAGRFREWLARGFAGEMKYMGRRKEVRSDTRLAMAGGRSAIVVGMNYGGTRPSGAFARYARGRDYHEVLSERLGKLSKWLVAGAGVNVTCKPYVDTGPILERDLARAAGLGWFGKNTNLINPGLGSFFFIGVLLVDLEMAADPPFDADRCGTCTRCLDACPTGALVEPGVLDARRCISYLTIELRGPIPVELRPLMGELVYGCDICQDVCPWNIRFSTDAALTDFSDDERFADPLILVRLDEAAFARRFSGTAVTRAERRGLARNAAVALGNRGNDGDEAVLAAAADADPDAMVREHAAFALASLRSRSAPDLPR